MDNKDKWTFGAGLGAEVSAMTINVFRWPDWVSYSLFICGLILLGYSFYKMLTFKPAYATWEEVKARGDKKRYYLEPLKKAFDELQELNSNLAAEASVLSLSEYDTRYFR